MRAEVVLITDVDNTLFDWVHFFGETVEAFSRLIAKRGRVDRARVLTELRREYLQQGHVEYWTALHAVAERMLDDRSSAGLLADLRDTFLGVAAQRLVPYEGVLSGLGDLRQHDVAVVAVSNSPQHVLDHRLELMGLGTVCVGVIGSDRVDGWRDSWESLLTNIEGRRPRRPYHPHPVDPALGKAEAYSYVIEKFGRGPTTRVFVVGDSIERDLLPAREVGAKAIWARYGAILKWRAYQELLAVTPWEVPHELPPIPEPPEWVEVVDRFDDLIELVTGQGRLDIPLV